MCRTESRIFLLNFNVIKCILGRLKVNMGNIYFKQKNYPKAVKLYRMALDQVPNTHRSMRQVYPLVLFCISSLIFKMSTAI